MSESPLFFMGTGQGVSTGEGTTRQILGHDSQLMMLRMDFEKGALGTVHQHPHTQATYILSGKFAFTIGGITQELQSGDACFMPSETPHGCVCLEKGSLIDVFTPERADFLSEPTQK